MKRPLWIFSLWLIALSVAVISCTASDRVAIQPLNNISGGVDGPHAQDISPHSATIVFNSGVPVVCNIAYGTDKQYGKMAVMSMAAAATEHELQLAGLEPNTTYHFKATVTDAAGSVYQSDDLTFRTNVATSETKPSGVNVATLTRGAKVTGVSSNWGGGDENSSFGGNKAIDGEPNTAWSSNGDGNKAWIEIELNQTYDLNVVGFWTRTMGNSAQIFSFKVITDSGQALGPFDLPDASTIYYFQVPVRAKSLKFEVERSSGGNTGAIEIEVYSLTMPVTPDNQGM